MENAALYIWRQKIKKINQTSFFLYIRKTGGLIGTIKQYLHPNGRSMLRPYKITPSRAGKGPGVRFLSLSLSLSFCGKIIPAINLTG